jgi:RNA 3'-terminal phosphate cyclase (ATP)
MGWNIEIDLILAGFFPRGGGEIQAKLMPASRVLPIHLVLKGKAKKISGISAVSNLPRKIAERQRNQVVKRLGSRYLLNDIRIVNLPSKHKGTLLLLLVECEHSRACFFGLGALGKPAEIVADEAIDRVLDFLSAEGAVDPYLADQLLLPMALAKESSKLSTSKLTNHLLTQARIIEKFLTVNITIDGRVGIPGIISVEPKT